MYHNLRSEVVSQIITCLAAEGLHVADADILILEAYIRGTLTSIDFLAHSRQFATLAEYEDWLLEHHGTSTEMPMDISVEQLLREFQEHVKRRHKAFIP